MQKLHTEKEYFSFNQIMIYRLANLKEINQQHFVEVSEFMPYYIFTNYRQDLTYNFANEASKIALETNDVSQISLSEIKRRFEPELTDHVFKSIQRFDKVSDKHSLCSTFQKFRINGKMTWIIGNKKIISDNSFFNLQYKLNDLGNVGLKLLKILDPIDKDTRIWQKFQSLTKKEKEILKLIAQGYTNKNIGNMLYITENTVRTHREQIRYKIHAKSVFDIIKFANAFDLIGALE